MENLKDIYASINTMDELDQYITDLHSTIESLRSELLEADSQNDSLKQANEILQEVLKMKTEDTSTATMIFGFFSGCILGIAISLFASKIPIGE